MTTRVSLLLALAGATGCSPVDTCSTVQSHPREAGTLEGPLGKRLHEWLKNREASGFSGSVLVAQYGVVVLHQGYGCDVGNPEKPVNPETAFWIASLSKQFTAAAVLKLAESGKLRIDGALEDYLENIPDDKRAITLRQLLTHTGGLGQNYAADGLTDRDESIRAVLKPPLRFRPGERFGYSNDGYTLLAAIIELTAGQPFESFLRENLFAPAGLHSTGFWGWEANPSIAGLTSDPPADVQRANWGYRGPTGVCSTTGDLYRWWLALQKDGVLTRKSRDLLLGPAVPAGSLGHHAMGWFVTETADGRKQIFSRGTEDTGNNGILVVYPDKDLVIITLSHAGASEGEPVTRKLAQGLAELTR